MRATVTGKNADGTTFSFEQVAEPKVIASGVNKGEAREHDLGDFLSHLSKQITRATEPLPGTDRADPSEIVISITY